MSEAPKGDYGVGMLRHRPALTAEAANTLERHAAP